MPDDIIISELSNAPQIDDSAVFPLTQDNGGSPATFKATMSQIAGKIGEGTTFANLHTTSKTLVGAINEAAQSGGSAELIGTASGSIATFADGGNSIPLKSCEVEIVAQQAGSGTPSPSNPRTISGFGSVKVNACGVNKFDKTKSTENKRTNNGVIISATGYSISEYIPVTPETTYYIMNALSSATGEAVAYYDKDKTFLSRGYLTSGSGTRTTPENCCFMIISYSTANVNTVGCNFPSTDTTYHAYNGTTHTIPLPETIYGGTAELVGGNGIKTHEYIDLSTLSWSSTSQNRWVATLAGVKEVTTGLSPIISEKYKTFSNNDLYYNNETGIATYNNQVIVRNDPTTDTPTGLAVFELQTPTAFTFTGATIPTLSGVNNVYADSGDVEVEYFNENADEIAELIKVMT